MNNAIEVKDLSVSFLQKTGPVHALNKLSLSVPTGHVFGFLGPNGAGKTTLMHVLLGFVPPISGQAAIFGTDVRKSIARQRIGYLPEHPDTYRFLTARELLISSGRLFGVERETLHERSDSLLAMLDLSDNANRPVGTFSRGMLQRICLGQALMNDPDLVILDEPTGGLDPFGRLQIRKIIADLKARGKTVFFSSHELSEVELVCDTIAILYKGHIVAEGPTVTLVPENESLERFFIRTIEQASNAMSATDVSGSRGGTPS